MSSAHPINRCVLQVRHLPKSFCYTQSTDLLRIHGAHTVTFKKSSAFGFFQDELVARQALHALHQLQLNESVLLVTFARSDDNAVPLLPPVLPQYRQQLSSSEHTIRKLHAVAPRLGLNYILDPMVKYKYPPVNDSILANICEALRANSNFYTQVLHLMNKMSMRTPFQTNACPSRVFGKLQKEAFTQMTESESESDLSDTEHIRHSKRSKTEASQLPAANRRPLRKAKVAISASKASLRDTNPIDVSECFEISRKLRRFEIAAVPSIVRDSEEQVPVSHEGFGRIDPPPPAEPEQTSKVRWQFDGGDFLHIEDMERISFEDCVDHPAFRNYEQGDSCVRLYVKNLDKSITENDLFRLFGQFVPAEYAERAIFDIRLMQSGRMRGQAFVTFGSVGSALTALEAANRVILNGKPMSVQFARGSRVTSQESS